MRIMRGRRMRYIVNTTVTGQFAGPNLPQVHVFDLLAGIVISIVLRQDFAYGQSYCARYTALWGGDLVLIKLSCFDWQRVSYYRVYRRCTIHTYCSHALICCQSLATAVELAIIHTSALGGC